MKIRTAIGTLLLCAHALSLALFPGGSVRCDDGRGNVSFKPLHGPRALSCCENATGASVPALLPGGHDHTGCTDTEASAPYAPLEPLKMRSLAAVSFAATRTIDAETPRGSFAGRPLLPPSPLAPHIATTVLRS